MSVPFRDRRILVVEDEMIVAWLLVEMLEQLGCHVVGPASDVSQALEIIGREPLDAALLDVNLNGELSYPVADALKARSIPFMFSTGYDRSGLRDGYRLLPMLQKPYHGSEFEKVLALMLTPGAGGRGVGAPIAA